MVASLKRLVVQTSIEPVTRACDCAMGIEDGRFWLSSSCGPTTLCKKYDIIRNKQLEGDGEKPDNSFSPVLSQVVLTVSD